MLSRFLMLRLKFGTDWLIDFVFDIIIATRETLDSAE
jgi:hypothetical protein